MASIRSLDTLWRVKVWTIITLIATATATPQVNYPLNLQLPPVARVGQAYSFQFASTTFQPESDKLQYSLVGSPSWLRISSNNRTLSGTPGLNDIGNASFTIAAAGDAGAVANMESNLLVEKDGPRVVGNASQYLSRTGQLSGPASVILLPSKPFEVKFDKTLFEANGPLVFYATLADHTPLPSWISFDAQTLRFAGTTPLSSAPQSFDILLIASDAPGFAGASISFTAVISSHQFLFKPLSQAINMSKGDSVQITGLRSKLFLDNAPVRDEDIESASAEIPTWLSFDDHSFDITGKPPSGLMSQDLSINVHDKFGDTARYALHVTFISKLFTTGIGQLNITAGQPFEYIIPKSVLVQDGETVSLELGDLGEWLKFDPATLSIQGTIPDDISSRTAQVALTATSSDGSLKDTQTFQVRISEASTTSGGTSTGTDPAHPGASVASDAHTVWSSKKRAGVIVGCIISSLVVASIMAFFTILCCRRKKQTKGYISPTLPRSPQKTDISRPILPITEDWDRFEAAQDLDLEKGKEEDDTSERTPEYPPQLDLNLTLKRRDSCSPASSIGEDEHDIIADFNSSPMGLQDEAGPSHQPHDSMKIPTEMARRGSANSQPPHLRTTQIYGDSIYRRNSGVPTNRRLTSVSQGRSRQTCSPSRSTNNLSQLRRSGGSSSYTTNTMSVASTVPSAYPQPPKARHTTQLTTPLEKRCSIRPIPASSRRESLSEDKRSHYEKRLSYIRKRKSAQSPFFGGAASRVSSSSYQVPLSPTGESGPAPSAALLPKSPNIVKLNNDTQEERTSKDLPESLRIRRPSETPSPTTPSNERCPGSLRKNRSAFMRRQTEAQTTKSPMRAERPYEGPGTTTIYSRWAIPRRASTRESLRATELKSSLNSHLKTQVYPQAEISDSEYSDEEDTIEECERRNTIKASEYLPTPLNLGKAKRSSKRDSKEEKRESKRELKRTSQRDPTPFSRAMEHGGKENQSSSYSLNCGVNRPMPTRSSTAMTMSTVRTTTSSPSRPKTSIGPRPVHTRTVSRAVARTSAHRNSQGRPLSREDSTKERHSRKSIHSRTQSRQSQPITAPKIGRKHTRSQSSAFPHIDFASIAANASQDNENITHRRSKRESKDSEYNCESREGRENRKTARQSRIAQLQLHTSPFYHSKRDTAIPTHSPSTSTPARQSHAQNAHVGLGLTFGHHAEETPAPDSIGRQSHREWERERTPLSVLDDGNGGSPERIRMVEGKGKRPISVEVEDDGTGAGRWGSLRGVWGRSTGFSTWGKDEKVFL